MMLLRPPKLSSPRSSAAVFAPFSSHARSMRTVFASRCAAKEPMSFFAVIGPSRWLLRKGESSATLSGNQCLSLMHRTCLQRVDRGSMRFQLETREPFLDPSIVRYAYGARCRGIGQGRARRADGQNAFAPTLRSLSRSIATFDPRPPKIPFNEGAGFDASQNESPWLTLAETAISDSELIDGKREFAPFSVTTKEELLYIRKLMQHMDISRVPHLCGRATIKFPRISRIMDKLKAYAA